MVTTNYVLVESFALIQRRLGVSAVHRFQQDMLPVIKVEWIDKHVHNFGVAALLQESKRELSLVDCISFVTIRHLGIQKVFAFDKHFEQHGFVLI